MRPIQDHGCAYGGMRMSCYSCALEALSESCSRSDLWLLWSQVSLKMLMTTPMNGLTIEGILVSSRCGIGIDIRWRPSGFENDDLMFAAL